MEQKQGKILIVDDNEDLLKAAKMHLKRHFAQVDTEKNPEALPALMNNEDYDVILLDMNFTKDVSSGSEGYYWLERILQLDPSAVVVLITAYGDIQMAVKAIKAGATDFVLKPWENEKLLATLYSAMRLRESRDVIESLKIKNHEINQALNDRYSEIIGQSSAMQKIFQTIDRVAKTDANVLILGENGTGKELIARAIHRNSARKNENFASVDLGSITETLFESELFGHKKGSFTDAKEDRAGRFELANGGTLFLDEIGNLSLPLQAKLLTVLQNRKVSRVGANKDTPIDIRLICATNMPLYEMVKENRFRQDLLYRINTIEIEIPALRERFEDIPLLANHFLKHYATKYDKTVNRISEGAMARMHKHPWPGNIRELQHSLERAIILSTGNVLQPEDFNFAPAAAKEDGQLSLEQYNLEEVEKLLIR
ncbi:MAG: sigma-54-dependent Fis family transcriptional regulator, partial [Marivirga sp.]|nr:sigma-54-dependent Fis family transcriptional regulator [Marivirga sp.]